MNPNVVNVGARALESKGTHLSDEPWTQGLEAVEIRWIRDPFGVQYLYSKIVFYSKCLVNQYWVDETIVRTISDTHIEYTTYVLIQRLSCLEHAKEGKENVGEMNRINQRLRAIQQSTQNRLNINKSETDEPKVFLQTVRSMTFNDSNDMPFFFGIHGGLTWYAEYLLWLAEQCDFYPVAYVRRKFEDRLDKASRLYLETCLPSKCVHLRLKRKGTNAHIYVDNPHSRAVLYWLNKTIDHRIAVVRMYMKWNSVVSKHLRKDNKIEQKNSVVTELEKNHFHQIANDQFQQLLSDHDVLEYCCGCFERALRRYMDDINHWYAGWPYYVPTKHWSVAAIEQHAVGNLCQSSLEEL